MRLNLNTTLISEKLAILVGHNTLCPRAYRRWLPPLHFVGRPGLPLFLPAGGITWRRAAFGHTRDFAKWHTQF